jgi:hypothetical protein
MKSAYTIAILSILGGLLVHLMVLLVIRIEGPQSPQPHPDLHRVQYLGSLGENTAPAIFDQAALYDSAPLFMPTEWNLVSEMSNVASLQSATEIFEPFTPQLSIVDAKPTSPTQGRVRIDGQSSRLPQGSAFMLSRFGRKEQKSLTSISRGVSFSVAQVGLSSDNAYEDHNLPTSIHASAPESLWNPVQLFLHLQGGVPIGLPLVAQSSGFADWDSSLQGYFTQLAFFRQLKDGYYQIWVYP